MRYIAGVLFLVIYLLLRWAVASGKTMRYVSSSHDIARHKLYGRLSVILTFIGVALVEIMSRSEMFDAAPWNYYFFWFIHLPVAIAFFLCLLFTYFRFTGERSPMVHRRLVYWVYYLYIVTFITGTLLLFPELIGMLILFYHIIAVFFS